MVLMIMKEISLAIIKISLLTTTLTTQALDTDQLSDKTVSKSV